MGRELRRVPGDWEHPRNRYGELQPMHDASFDEAMDDWIHEANLWRQGEHPDQVKVNGPYTYAAYADWAGPPPHDPAYYRPAWTEHRQTHYQVYETVSEGTPVSPVLASPEAVIDWWMNVGDPFTGTLSREEAERWMEAGSSPTMFYSPETGLIPGAKI